MKSVKGGIEDVAVVAAAAAAAAAREGDEGEEREATGLDRPNDLDRPKTSSSSMLSDSILRDAAAMEENRVAER